MISSQLLCITLPTFLFLYSQTLLLTLRTARKLNLFLQNWTFIKYCVPESSNKQHWKVFSLITFQIFFGNGNEQGLSWFHCRCSYGCENDSDSGNVTLQLPEISTAVGCTYRSSVKERKGNEKWHWLRGVGCYLIEGRTQCSRDS